MKITPTALPGVLVLEPRVFHDERGYFLESFNAQEFARLTGLRVEFVQDNHSHSLKRVLRGLHYQVERPQGKLVRVVAGRVLDVAVDLRRSSPAFGRWVSEELSAENHRQLWVPPGFAHGYVVLSESADFLYKTTDYYHPAGERAIRWSDADLAIDWRLDGPPVLNAKDRDAGPFRTAETYP
jgi:dTDP-4-dehydrorhamnose 3,5-epimerase